MTKEEVTLIAACLAAFISLISLLINLYDKRNSELRTAHRTSLEPHIARMGEAIHQIVVSTNIYLFRAISAESKKNWLSKAEFARDEIKSLRRELRYPLWGLEEGLKQIARICDFATHLANDIQRSKKLMDTANTLKDKLDDAIRKSYARGTPPKYSEIRAVNKAAMKIKKLFNKDKS